MKTKIIKRVSEGKAARSRRSLQIIARLVIEGHHRPDLRSARVLLAKALRQMQGQCQFLITPGGFIELPWHYKKGTPLGWCSDKDALKTVIPQAQAAITKLMTPSLCRLARVDFITVCVDILTPEKLKGPHVELVGVYSMKEHRVISWTGKSYPLPMQEMTLLHERNFASHIVEAGGERILLLGCHDLNMFSPRSWANQKEGSHRYKVSQTVLTCAKEFQPTVVLHHPHGTDSDNIWTLGWVGLRRTLPTVKVWASSVGYYNYHEPDRPPRAALASVLQATRCDGDNVQDLVVKP